MMSVTAKTMTIPHWLQKQWEQVSHTLHPTHLARQQAWEMAKKGLSCVKDENWKYADLSFLHDNTFPLVTLPAVDDLDSLIETRRLPGENSMLLVIVDGYFIPSLSDVNQLSNLRVLSLSQAYDACLLDIMPDQQINNHYHAFAQLNSAMWQDGLFLHVLPQNHMEQPIHLLSITTQSASSYPRHFIVVDENARLTLLEEHISLDDDKYLKNISTTIVLKSTAKLKHYKVQQESKEAIHIAHTLIKQAANSHLETTCFSLGSKFARDDLIIKLEEEGASCHLNSLYHTQYDQQYVDHHIVVDHLASDTQSEMLYKGIVDKKSRAVFNGHLLVPEKVKKITAFQANHNLLLSKTAEAFSKPTLEIYADDIKCKHGATIGQVSQDALFYLRSRGISQVMALNILLQGFMEDIIKRISSLAIKQHITRWYFDQC